MPKSITVLELFGEPIDVGGEESYVFNTLDHMDMSGLVIDVLTPYRFKNDIYRRQVTEWGGEAFELALPFRPGQSREYIARELNSFFEHHSYEVVHVHSGSTSVLAIGASIAKKHKVPNVIVHSHCASSRMGIKQQLIRTFYGLRMHGCVDSYCACSLEAGKSKYMSGALRELKILGNGVDTSLYRFSENFRQSVRAEAKVGDSTLVVGNVGRLGFQKNQLFALDVFCNLHEVWPDTMLWLVGDGQDRSKLEEEVSSHGLGESVRFWGNRPDVPKILAGMDVFLFPSVMEGFPIALLEAQCNGLPCLISTAVTREVNCSSGFVIYEELISGPRVWASRIVDLAGRRNLDAPSQIIGRGYDINMTASQLRSLYFGGAQ